MIPVLFKEDEQIFTHNGIGALYESLSCDVIEEENGAFTMELEYPVDGELFSELKDFRIIQAKPNDIDDPHNFRIYEIEKSIDELTVFVRANTRTNDLGNNLITEYIGRNVTPQQAMNGIKSNLIEGTNFDLISDIQTRSSVEWTRVNPLNAIVGVRGSLVDIWGGQLKRTNTAIYLYSRRGRDNVVTIRPGKNIEGLNMTVSTAGIVTKILPTFSYRPVDVPKYHMVTNSDGTKEKRRVQTSGSTTLRDDITVLGDVVSSQYVDNYPTNHWSSVDYGDDDELKNTVDEYIDARLTYAEESTGIVDMSGFDQELKNFVKTELDKKAKQYFTHRNPGVDKPTVRITVNMLQLSDSPDWEEFKDLERIGLTDTLDVWVEEYDIDVEVRVTSLTYESIGELVKGFNAGSDGAPRQSAIEKKYDDLTKATNDYITSFKNGVQNIMRNTADGLNRKFEGYTEPPAELSSEGDIWFKEIGEGKVEIWIHDGVYWQPLMTEDFGKKIEADMLEQQKDIDDAKEAADEAVRMINDDILGKFTDIDQELLDIEAVSNSAQANAQTALNQSLEALGDASTALTNAQTALNRADTAIGSASNAATLAGNALTKADEAQDAATILSGQVSGFETTVAGFNQTVNNYEGQVSGFRNDILGLRSTVSNYETEVDEFGNAVFTYATEVSNLTNTVHGFNSVVTQVQYDFDNMEIGGRNLIVLSELLVGRYLIDSSGEVSIANAHAATDFVVARPLTEYIFSGVSEVFQVRFVSYDVNKNFISGVLYPYGRGDSQVYKTPENTEYIRVSADFVRGSHYNDWVLERGNIATDWTPAPEDMATVTQVSILENTIDGLNHTVAGYETELIGYRGDVTQYQNQVSTLTNTVDGFNSTVANYTTEVNEFGNTVATYATEVSTLNNTVSGFESTVATYGTEVSNLAGEVVGYQNQVSTLNNTVDGFNSVVTQVQYDLDNIEIGGRNLIVRYNETTKAYLSGSGSNPGTTNATYPNPPYRADGEHSTMLEAIPVVEGEKLIFTKSGNGYWRCNWLDEGYEFISRFVISSREFTETAPAGAHYLWVSYPTDEVVQIERGNKATDWTPAPEDMATTTQVSELSNTVDGFQSKVSKVEQDYAGVSGTVATHTSEISNLNGQIALKANTSTVNTLTGRVSTAETGITANATAIGLKASQSSVDTLTGTVNTLSGRVDVTAGQISSKVWNTDIQTAVDGIEVGGRNLLRNSNNISYNSSSPNLSNYVTNSDGSFTFTPTVDITSGYLTIKLGGVHSLAVLPNRDIEFTASFEIKADQSVQNIIKLFTGVGGTYLQTRGHETIDNNWKRVYVTSTSSGNSWRPHLNGFLAGVTYTIRNFKLERGNIATDWTPAPEDTEALINHVESELTQKHDTITATVSSIDGRVATNKLSLDGTITRVGNVEGKITTIETNVSGLQTTVAGKAAQSQVTQLADGLSSVVTDLENLEIGGRNYLSSNNLIRNTWIRENNGITETNTSHSGTDFIQIEPNSSYIISANPRLSRDSGNAFHFLRIVYYDSDKMYIEGSNNLTSVVGANEFTTYSPSGSQYMRFSSTNERYESAGSMESTWKLEKGNIATDWTPAPEDMATQSQITQLSDNINLRVQKGELLSQINIEADRQLFQSGKILFDAENIVFSGTAWMDGAVIANASITNAKIADATISSAKIASLDVSKLSGNTTNFVRSAWNAINSMVSIDGTSLKITTTNTWDMHLGNAGVTFTGKTGALTGSLRATRSTDGDPEGTLLVAERGYLAGIGRRMVDRTIRASVQVEGNTGDVTVTRPMRAEDSVEIGAYNRLRTYQDPTVVAFEHRSSVNDSYDWSSDRIWSVAMKTRMDVWATLNMNGYNITGQSDYRLKRDVNDTELNSLASIESWRIVDFNWIDDILNKRNGRQMGLVAQDTPDLAIYDAESDTWSINSSKQIMMNTHAIQQLSLREENTNQVASQALQLGESNKSEIDELKEEIKGLRNRIEELESAA